MAAADLITEAEAITVPEITIIAGKGSASTGGCGGAVLKLKPVEKPSSSCEADAVCVPQESRWLWGQEFGRILQRQLRQLR